MRSSLVRAGLLGVMLLTACQPAPAPTSTGSSTTPVDEKAAVQSLRIGVGALPNNMTPQATTTYHHTYYPMYDSLTVLNEKFEPQPNIATKWDLSADALKWTFTIRNDVKFSNGDKLTAEDVAFSVSNVLASNWPARAQLASVTGARVVDPNTVEIALRAPDMAIPNNAIYLWIIPKAYYEKVGFEGFVQKPVGSGPYDLVDYKVADSVRFKKRAEPHAFRKAVADELFFKVVPDKSQMVTGMKANELDIVTQASFTGEQAEAMKLDGFQMVAPESANLTLMMPQVTYDSKNTPLKDKRVRQALNYAVDRETIAKVVFKGFTRAVGQFGTPGSPYWDDNIKAWPFDQAKAKSLLAEAGVAPGSLKLVMETTPGFMPQEVALAVQSDLKNVGIDVEINMIESALFFDKYFGRQPKGDLFPLQSGENTGFYTSGKTAQSCRGAAGAAGYGFTCVPAWEAAMDAAYGEKDPAKRAALLKAANKIMIEEVPGIFLTTQAAYTVNNPKVRGIQLWTPNIYNFDTAYLVK